MQWESDSDLSTICGLARLDYWERCTQVVGGRERYM